jgi:hypothetical protein
LICVHSSQLAKKNRREIFFSFVAISLINMYTKCGEHLRMLGGECSTRCHLKMVSGHVKCGQGQKALELFWQICNRRYVPCMKLVLHDVEEEEEEEEEGEVLPFVSP